MPVADSYVFFQLPLKDDKASPCMCMEINLMNAIGVNYIALGSIGNANRLSLISDKPLLTNNKLKTHLDSVVHKYVTIYMQDTSTNSIAIGIYDNGKKHMYSYGEVRRGGGIPITNDHFFNIGSVAKTFVTTMLAEAVVEKKAKLTDDIRKYLPGTYANLEFKETPISLINLANHTSGLPISFHTFSPSDIDRISKLDVTGKIMFYNSYN